MEHQHFDTIAVGIIDFKKLSFDSFLITADETLAEASLVYFDLASVTKPLSLHLMYLLHGQDFKDPWQWLLHHSAGLPPYTWLDKDRWREQVLAYDLKKSPTVYSDLSAIRLGLEIEKKYKSTLGELVRPYHHPELVHWSTLPAHAPCPRTGFREGVPIRGKVHDPRAFLSTNYMAHAGLFSSVTGVAETLLEWQRKFSFIEKTLEHIQKFPDDRFALGWDRAQDPKLTLAGPHCGKLTFGHTGFVGNAVWINGEKNKGAIILSNGTQNYWYDKDGLNKLRRSVATYAWTGTLS